MMERVSCTSEHPFSSAMNHILDGSISVTVATRDKIRSFFQEFPDFRDIMRDVVKEKTSTERLNTFRTRLQSRPDMEAVYKSVRNSSRLALYLFFLFFLFLSTFTSCAFLGFFSVYGIATFQERRISFDVHGICSRIPFHLLFFFRRRFENSPSCDCQFTNILFQDEHVRRMMNEATAEPSPAG